jgi:hypothetical protein
MATANPSIPIGLSTSRPSTRQILLAGAVAIAASAAANGMLSFVLGKVLSSPATFLPLQPAPVLSSTVVAVAVGVGLFAALTRVSANPIRTFTIIAAIAIPVSLAAPAGAYFANLYPGTTAPRILGVMTLHICAGLITIAVVRACGSAGRARG